LLVIGGAMFGLLRTYGQKQQVYHRKALAISEYGLLVALQKIGEQPSWTKGFSEIPYEGGWYKVRIENLLEKDTLLLKIVSIGHYRSVSDSRQCILKLDTSGGDSVWVRQSMF
jgi:hypothetical protein